MPFDQYENRMQMLMQRLLRSTQEGKAVWSPTADKDVFRLSSSVATIQIRKETAFNPDFDHEYTIRSLEITNPNGRVVEEYRPSETGMEMQFDQVFESARRTALGTDAILDSLMEEFG